MIVLTPWKRKVIGAARCAAGFALVSAAASAQVSSPPPARPTQDYLVYVGAESADRIYRIRFGPAGTVVEKTIHIGELPTDTEGPHGLAISRDGRLLHMTT